LQGISYSVTREKAPVYTMGSADPRAYARNKRGIAGNLIWINFDRDSLLALVEAAGGQFVADVDEIRPAFVNTDQIDASAQAIFATSLTRTSGPAVGSTIDTFNTIGQTGVNDFSSLSTPWYHDQILPFDITLSGVNEQGAAAAMKILGVEILNSGGGNSIDDAVNEQTATFVARSVEGKTRCRACHNPQNPTRGRARNSKAALSPPPSHAEQLSGFRPGTPVIRSP
jgi:hypothetical protein